MPFPSVDYLRPLELSRRHTSIQASGQCEFRSSAGLARNWMKLYSIYGQSRRNTAFDGADIARNLPLKAKFSSASASTQFLAGHEVRLVKPVSSASMATLQRAH